MGKEKFNEFINQSENIIDDLTQLKVKI